jgi:hypothetical protein
LHTRSKLNQKLSWWRGGSSHENGIPKIDWDFGYLHFWCGIDPFKMARTLNNTSGSGGKIWDGKDIFEQCEKYLKEDGYLYKYKNQYYFDWAQLSLKKESLQQNKKVDFRELR